MIWTDRNFLQFRYRCMMSGMRIFRQELFQSFSYTNRTTARTTATMRCRESLMQIDMHHIEAHISRTACAEHRIQVSSVIIHQSATLMNELCYFRNVTFKESQSIWVCHHHGSNAIIEQSLQILNIHNTVSSTLHLYYIQSANSCRCRVCAMCRVRNNNLCTLFVATAFMIQADYHQSCQLSMCSSKRIKSKVSQSGNLRKSLSKSIINFQCAFHCFSRLQRMQMCELWHCSYFLIYSRIVFHCATAQRIEAIVNTEVVATMICIMANHCHFITLRQLSIFLATQFLWHCILSELVLWQRISFSARLRQFEYQISI